MKGASVAPPRSEGAEVLSFEELKREIRSGTILQRLLRYDEVRLLTPDLETMTKPFLTGLAARLLARRRALVVDEAGREAALSLPLLVGCFARMVRDGVRLGPYLHRL